MHPLYGFCRADSGDLFQLLGQILGVLLPHAGLLSQPRHLRQQHCGLKFGQAQIQAPASIGEVRPGVARRRLLLWNAKERSKISESLVRTAPPSPELRFFEA